MMNAVGRETLGAEVTWSWPRWPDLCQPLRAQCVSDLLHVFRHQEILNAQRRNHQRDCQRITGWHSSRPLQDPDEGVIALSRRCPLRNRAWAMSTRRWWEGKTHHGGQEGVGTSHLVGWGQHLPQVCLLPWSSLRPQQVQWLKTAVQEQRRQGDLCLNGKDNQIDGVMTTSSACPIHLTIPCASEHLTRARH